MRIIDSKFHIEGERIIKTSNGEAVPDDEPLFVFRARDYLALGALQSYRALCVNDGCTEHQLTVLDGMITKFKSFIADHPDRLKQPGITKGL